MDFRLGGGGSGLGWGFIQLWLGWFLIMLFMVSFPYFCWGQASGGQKVRKLIALF